MSATTTRRTLLRIGTEAAAYAAGAAVVTAAGVAIGSAAKGVEPVSTAAWDAAFARLTQAKHAAELAGWEDPEAENYSAAWHAVIEMPAPHVGALHWKLQDLFGRAEGIGDKHTHCESWSYDCVQPVLDDARRLAEREVQ